MRDRQRGAAPLWRFCQMDRMTATQIRSFNRPKARSEAGQAFLLPILSLVVLLGMAAMVIDVGSWYRARRHAQAVVDAAALAAAQALPADTPAATNLAIQYAQENGTTISDSNVSFSDSIMPHDTVTVQMQEREPSFFAKV